jgi:molybdopterin/thiamine biosynthesis adenylyltransferase
MTRASFKEISPLRMARTILAPSSSRLPECIGMPPDAGAILSGLKIMIVGGGSVGSLAALHFARLQVHSLFLADRGAFKPESVLTHAWLPIEGVTKPKASFTGQFCRKISPETGVFAFDGEAQSLPSTAFADVDYVFLATDNLKAETDVDEQCVRWGVPLIQAAVHGETLTAQVRFFSHAGDESLCLRCGYSAAEEKAASDELVFSCQGALEGKSRGRAAAMPTMSTSFLCSMAAELGVMQVFRHALGLGKPVANTSLEYCGYTHRTVVSPLTRNPNCLCDHRVWRRVPAPRPSLADCTLADLVAATGHHDREATTITVDDDLHFIESAVCRGGHRAPIGRFGLLGESVGACAICGASMQPDNYFAHRTAALPTLGAALDEPLHTLGAAPSWVMVRRDQEPFVFRSAQKALHC